MNLVALLTSFDGRIGRARFWLAYIAIAVVGLLIALVLGVRFFDPEYIQSVDGMRALGLVGLANFVLLGWPTAAVVIKRLHDRNRPAWLAALVLVPGLLSSVLQLMGLGATADNPFGPSFILSMASAVVGLWVLVDLGILRGTRGPNQYGPDPVPDKSQQAKA